MDPVVHFEMPYTDAHRAAAFYQKAFGWKTQQLGEEMGNYLMLITAEQDAKPAAPAGTINGGMFKKESGYPDEVSVVIAVDDITLAAKKITAQGGEVLGEPQHIPGVGLYLAFRDPEGNRNSILQPTK